MTNREGRRRRQKRHKRMARKRRAKAAFDRVLRAYAIEAMAELQAGAIIARAIRCSVSGPMPSATDRIAAKWNRRLPV